ncbi:MAG TPA: aspartate kinase [Candidatus Saccharimonadales bacterium]|nr:aspartate kinase [Candidatus Saccharimonadales bacterium]
MKLLVQKYGGTSVGSPERIRAVAARVARARREADGLVVVVSAMGETTDQLVALARRIHPEPPRREMDMLLTAGERISMALLAMALRLEGVEAISFTGSQSGIITDTAHGRARIQEVRGDRIREELARGRVVIVAGFQGVSREREVTTLGRGGSDTTAVALAGALGAARCEIYTDVPGVMTADPRIVPGARLVRHLAYPTAITLTALGAGVLVPRATSLGYTLGIRILVRSSWDDGPGTLIDSEAAVEERGLVAVTSASRVEWVEWDPALAPGGLKGCTVLALQQGAPGGRLHALVQAPEGAPRSTPPGVRLQADGDLASLVTAGAADPALLQQAQAVARRLGIEVRASFAGLGHLSLLVPAGRGQQLCAAWHEEFLDPRREAGEDRPG